MKYICISCWTSKSAGDVARSFHTIFVRRGADNIPTGVCTSCLAVLSNPNEHDTYSKNKVAV
jgi:hypothetical protein